MCDGFFAFSSQNYARFLTYYSCLLMNLEENYPGAEQLMRRGVISVTRSLIPDCRVDTNKTIEETIMRHTKSRGGFSGQGVGLTGLLHNQAAYQRWIRATSKQANATLSMAGMLCEQTNYSKNRGLSEVAIRRSEKRVVTCMRAFHSMINPFNTDNKEHLVSVSSGIIASKEVEGI